MDAQSRMDEQSRMDGQSCKRTGEDGADWKAMPSPSVRTRPLSAPSAAPAGSAGPRLPAVSSTRAAGPRLPRARSNLRSSAGRWPIGLITGRIRFATLTAASLRSWCRCMSRRQPVVPARWAPARQCTRQFFPAASAPSTRSKRGLTKLSRLDDDSSMHRGQQVCEPGRTLVRQIVRGLGGWRCGLPDNFGGRRLARDSS